MKKWKDHFFTFVIYLVVCFIVWPILELLWGFIANSHYVFNFGRNLEIAFGFAVLWTLIQSAGDKKKGD